MFKSGEFTQQYVEPKGAGELDPDRVETHGVELTVDKLHELSGKAVMKDGNYKKSSRTEAPLKTGNLRVVDDDLMGHKIYPIDDDETNNYEDGEVIEMDNPFYKLYPGPYVVAYNEIISVPDDHIGFVIPRSRVIRTGLDLSTAVWDSGYNGKGEGGLTVGMPSFLEKDMGIGHFVLAKATVYNQYDGSHNNENI
jgi:Deoxycytidine deaminase